MEEISEERGKSMAAPAIFVLVFFIKHSRIRLLVSGHQHLRKLQNLEEWQLRRRRSLRNIKKCVKKDMNMSFSTYEKLLLISKVVTYVLLVLWFWKMPVTTISDQLVQPFGKLISWRAGRSLEDDLAVM
ncbi:Unknown protein [Striga hermonthica]|uniref:Uncharacterized protein n=1 Tax=Striga hermonthica TaxID=68872 RepID=A0A9N7R2F2_STRHE|nr:Unknown protein [Striga hermonthica]